ncbi:MAG: AsmA-like C-terminal region-containing protein [Leeuwenhoekiella sp.]
MKTPKTKKKRTRLTKWLRRIGLVVVLIIFVPSLLFIVGWQNRGILIQEVQLWYKINHTGVLEIGSVDANFLAGFTNIGFTIKDIYHSENNPVSFKQDSLTIDVATVIVNASDLLQGNFKFKRITINEAAFYSKRVSDQSYDYHAQLKLAKPETDSVPIVLPSWLNPKKTKFSINNFKVQIKDSILNKHFDLEFSEMEGTLTREQENLIGSMSFEAVVNRLGFNTEKGSYLKNTKLRGEPKFNLDTKQKILNISEFLLALDAEKFVTRANFDLFHKSYHLGLANENLDFSSLQKFLADSISKKVAPYSVTMPIQTSLTLDGKFRFKDMPKLNAQFATTNNEIVYNDTYTFEDVDFQGSATTDLYNSDLDDHLRSPKDFKLFLEQISGKLDSIKLKAKNSYFQSTDEHANYIAADLDIHGPNASLARILENENFDFRGGEFSFTANVRGDIDEPDRILAFSQGKFLLKDSRIIYRKNGLQLPVESIALQLDNEITTLEELSIQLPKSENLVLTGNLTNLSSLVTNNPLEPTTSFLQLASKSLDVDELISTALEMIPEKSAERLDGRKSLNEVLYTVFNQFQPQFALDLDEVKYNSIQLQNLNANVTLAGPETITINTVNFDYQKSKTAVAGSLIIPQSEPSTIQPLVLDVQVNSQGALKVFQELFDIQLVDINGGDYSFSGFIAGDLQHFEEVLDNTSGDLKLKDARFYYPAAGLDVVFDSLGVKVARGNITLEKVALEVGELYPFILNGNIKNFPKILLDESSDAGSIFLNINAPYLNGDEWIKMIASLGNEKDTPDKKTRVLSKVFKDVNRLHPKVNLTIDSLKYKGLITKKVNGSAYFENDSVLKLDHLDIRYKNSEAHLAGILKSLPGDTTESANNPFVFEVTADASGQTEDLNDYLKTINFIFDSGRYKFSSSYRGEALDVSILNADTKGNLEIFDSTVNFTAADLLIPIDRMHLEINNDFASLKTLQIDLPGKSALNINGSIDNFSSFINQDNTTHEHISLFNIESAYLNTSDINTLFEETTKENDSAVQKPLDIENFKTTLNSLNTTYSPIVSLQIDSLIHQNLHLSNFTTDIRFDNNKNLKIENANVLFNEEQVALEVTMNPTEAKNLPIKVSLKADSLNLQKLMKGLNYVGDKYLVEADTLGGLLDLNLNASGILMDDGSLNTNSLNGELYVNLQNLKLYNYKPIMESVFLMKEERFEKLEFRPIVQTFKVTDGIISIPRTEIQSSALHLFIEGKLKLEESIDLWISVPWKNLKVNDGLGLPKSKSFDEAGSKFYINMVQDQEGDSRREQKLRFKFRLWSSKLND